MNAFSVRYREGLDLVLRGITLHIDSGEKVGITLLQISGGYPHTIFLISSPEHKVLMVSYCGQSMSIVLRASSVVRRPLCVVRRAASTIALKAYSSNTPGPIDSILGRNHQGDL